MKKLRHILQSKHLIKIITIIIFIITLLYTNYYPFKSKYTKDDKEFIGIVTKYEVKEDKITIEIKAKEKLLITYKYQDKEFNNLSYGDKIKVKGTLITPSKNTNQNTFNYQKYLYYKKIYYLVEATSINKIANNHNYLYTIKNTLYQKINKLKSSNYIKTLLFCDNTLSKEIKESYRINGISHLFSVSGMHINFFVSIIYLYLNKITYNKRIKYLITNIFIITYLILFPSSSLLRSAVMSILYSINYLLKLKIKKIDILLLTLGVSLLINPFIIYDLGYIYSYTITFFLVLSSSTLKKKNKINKIIYISLLSFLVSIPITIYNSFEINIISILLNIILVPIISIIILPLTILTYIFPILDSILYLFANTLETISLFISKINITKIIFPKPSLLIIVLYYIIFLLSYQNKKYFYLNIILLIIIYISPYLNSNFEVVMFEVGEADCHLIKYPYNKNTILIDTGKNEYKIKNEVIPYLKSIGIKKIDYLIITHGDEDHIGGSITLINNFQVKNVILNKGTFTDIEKELIKNLNKKKIPYQININKINLSNHTIYLLNNTKYNNENDNSIITYFTYQKYKFLYMGDASITTEDNLLENYNLNNISILKVGHHGSNTSSSKDFISQINPSISLISVGENNIYHHPNKEVINNLSKSRIYRTDINNMVKLTINSKGILKVTTIT
ncbi:MAG: DNA internalization-related competence protein ComEC/Rec2 [Firmicutes bacterium CAG:321_26_22]|nr:MAG: DNA internalization-related competence protein ComEC/Rec2 [Firmicutes bacterium CAG:321_26_22]